MKQDNKIR